jgi:hypothetical protein
MSEHGRRGRGVLQSQGIGVKRVERVAGALVQRGAGDKKSEDKGGREKRYGSEKACVPVNTPVGPSASSKEVNKRLP